MQKLTREVHSGWTLHFLPLSHGWYLALANEHKLACGHHRFPEKDLSCTLVVSGSSHQQFGSIRDENVNPVNNYFLLTFCTLNSHLSSQRDL